MEGSDGSPPQSLCMIRACELFPKQLMEKEDAQLVVPFQELAGESVSYLGRTDDGVLALSNYRIFLLKNSSSSETSVPLGLIELAQARDLFHLIINCKDASTVKCSFETAEQCAEWQRRVQQSVGVPETLESLFAFSFCSWTCDIITGGGEGDADGNGDGLGVDDGDGDDDGVGVGVGVGDRNGNGIDGGPSTVNGTNLFGNHDSGVTVTPCPPATMRSSDRLRRASPYSDDFMHEVERLGFDLKGSWRISHANDDFKLCPSYPQKILVPCCISDETLQTVANFRGSRRLPAVVWRHKKSGAVIARCSQPEVGWLGWRNHKDEQLLKALADACAFDRGEQMHRYKEGATTSSSNDSTPSSLDGSHEEVRLDEVRKVLIVDARSYTSAVTNRARGGGCECIEYYPCAEIEFMNLGNIHVVRKSFYALRQLCASPPDVPNWLGMLEKTMWLQHLSGLLAASLTVCHAIEKKGRPVLVHCSDGWDRTPQIVATAQLCLDPFYRTVEGFRILVEREWLSYGHKFADRCGHGPGSDETNERCPVFLQWLDVVHQIHKQFPCSFEFSMGYLIKLAQHSLSCLFGTFLCNTLKERIDNSVFERTFSVWPFLSGPMYRNPLYVANKNKVLWPAHNLRDLSLWTEVYFGSLGNQNFGGGSSCNADGLQDSISPMIKTRSYGDLVKAGITQNGISRRSSDPNMSGDPNLSITLNADKEITNLDFEREDSPNLIAHFIHDTTRKLQNLTIELNTHDDMDSKCSHNESAPIATMQGGREADEVMCDPSSLPLQNGEKTIDGVVSLHRRNSSAAVDVAERTASGICDSSPIVGCEKSFKSADHVTPMTTTITNIVSNMSDIAHNNGGDHIKVTAHEEGQTKRNGISKHRIDEVVSDKNSTDLHLMRSVDLNESNADITLTGEEYTASAEYFHTLWHGSNNTSTDTLVPIESKETNAMKADKVAADAIDIVDGVCTYMDGNDPNCTMNTSQRDTNRKIMSNNSKALQQCHSILPKVHSRPSALVASTSAMSTSMSSSRSSLNDIATKAGHRSGSSVDQCPGDDALHVDYSAHHVTNLDGPMEDSILILPEYQKLEISISGKCETIDTKAKGTNDNNPIVRTDGSHHQYHHQRRRTTSMNSRVDSSHAKFINGSTTLRFPVPGVRSLPLTPPGTAERAQMAIACPDGLAHALSEQNIRLQQIVHDHKIREDALLREIHDMRLALLKRNCPNCSNIPAINDEQIDEHFSGALHEMLNFCFCCCASGTTSQKSNDDKCHRRRCPKGSRTDRNAPGASVVHIGYNATSATSTLDNVENASVCSWEAVEERSVSASCISSSIQRNASSVLWVPDHAVSRCTSCQTEFWIGCRRHHCRSCGQIFCANCSEFWAPLPDEELFKPVRLCGPCYHSVTSRMQVSQLRNSSALLRSQHVDTTTASSTTTTAQSITKASA